MFGHKKHNQPPPPPAGAGYPTASPPMMPQHEPTFKIFCRADEAYCLTIRHDAVVLAPTNPRDEYQAPLVQGHEAQHAGERRGGPPGVRAGEQGHRAGRQALDRPVPPRQAHPLQPGVPGRVRAVDREQRRGQGLPLHPHGQQPQPQLRRPPRRQVPRRGARRHRRRALGVLQGGEPELEDPALGRRRWRVRVRVRRRLVRRPGCLRASACVWRRLPPPAGRRGGLPAAACPRRRGVRAAGRRVRVRQPAPRAGVRVHRARPVQRRRGLQPDGEERHRVPRAHQPQRRVPALGEGHEVQHQDQGRGGVPCVRPGEQDHRRSHQALPRAEPPREACGLQPGVHGRVGAVDGEPRRGQGLPLHPHGEQHLPQLRRAPRRQGPRRRPRRHRGRALGVVQGRQPALEDRPLVVYRTVVENKPGLQRRS